MRVTFNLTQHDIRAGVAVDAFSCPIALAIKRKIKPGLGVAVGATFLEIAGITIDLTKKCCYIIRDVDNGDRFNVQPCRFTLTGIPKQFVRK